MRTEFGFEPKYTTAAAFDDFRDSLGPGAVSQASQPAQRRTGGVAWLTPR